MDGLILQILMDGFSGIFDIGWVDLKLKKDKLIDEKEL